MRVTIVCLCIGFFGAISFNPSIVPPHRRAEPFRIVVPPIPRSSHSEPLEELLPIPNQKRNVIAITVSFQTGVSSVRRLDKSSVSRYHCDIFSVWALCVGFVAIVMLCVTIAGDRSEVVHKAAASRLEGHERRHDDHAEGKKRRCAWIPRTSDGVCFLVFLQLLKSAHRCTVANRTRRGRKRRRS